MRRESLNGVRRNLGKLTAAVTLEDAEDEMWCSDARTRPTSPGPQGVVAASSALAVAGLEQACAHPDAARSLWGDACRAGGRPGQR